MKKFLSILTQIALLALMLFGDVVPVAHASQTVIYLAANPGAGNQTWTVPADWDSSHNTIEIIGAGGRGGTTFGGANGGSCGGGGGAYAKITNLTLTSGGSVTYAIGAGATTTNGTMANETYFNNTASSSASVSATYGKMGGAVTSVVTCGPTPGGSAANSTGTVKNAGGVGGSVIANGGGGSGGGGAGGPGGDGKAGGNYVGGGGGGGGGGNSGGTVGANNSGTTGGNGGASVNSTAGGSGTATNNDGGPGSQGSGGGGGGGDGASFGNGGHGGDGVEWDASHGSGGGGGGAGRNSPSYVGGAGGKYGGGGGGSSSNTGAAPTDGGNGAPGIIVITYTPKAITHKTYIDSIGTKSSAIAGPTSGLVGYWTFDGKDTNWNTNKVTDVSGNNNTGTLVSMSTTSSPVAGEIGQALKFNGVNNYVVTSSSFGAMTNYTFTAWIKLNALGIEQHVVETGNPQFYIGTTNKLTFNGWQGNTALQANKWYFVSGTRDAGGQNMYLNGVSDSVLRTGIDTGAGSIYIGRYASGGYYFNGSIDEVRVYSRALSQTEITQLYNLGKAKLNINTTGSNKGRSSISGPTSGLVGYWSFNGPDTDWSKMKTYDMSNSYATGTMISMSTTTSPAGGVIGQALKFNGESSGGGKVGVPLTTNTNNLSAMTISEWVYAKSYGPYNNGSFVTKENNGTGGWFFAFEGGYGDLWLRVGYGATNLNAYSSAGSFPSSYFNKWKFVTMTWDGTTNASGVTFYINGVVQSHYTTGETNGSGSRNSDTTYNLQIGNVYFQGRTFNGLIDDVRIYSRALTQTEITQLYNLGKAKFNVKL